MFDDQNEREMNWPQDRFAAARVLFMMFNNNCTKFLRNILRLMRHSIL